MLHHPRISTNRNNHNKITISPNKFNNFIRAQQQFPSPKTTTAMVVSAREEVFSRKVFVGGLPLDITHAEVERAFSPFGSMEIQWSEKNKNGGRKNGQPSGPGYVFLVFVNELSVHHLLAKCRREETAEGHRYFFALSSTMQRDKVVQVRPWLLSDAEFKASKDAIVNPRWTIFIGGLPRPTRAMDLYKSLKPDYGDIVYIGIDLDSELRYPKGSARICFAMYMSLVATMAVRFVNIPDGDGGEKRVEMKPYTMADQPCDQCDGKMCAGLNAKYYCANAGCLQYFCEPCWNFMHHGRDLWKYAQRDLHSPFVRMGDSFKPPTPPVFYDQQQQKPTADE